MMNLYTNNTTTLYTSSCYLLHSLLHWSTWSSESLGLTHYLLNHSRVNALIAEWSTRMLSVPTHGCISHYITTFIPNSAPCDHPGKGTQHGHQHYKPIITWVKAHFKENQILSLWGPGQGLSHSDPNEMPWLWVTLTCHL